VKYAIATNPSGVIGKEVVPEGIKVLNAVGKRLGLEFE
jgi:isocitrate/isopropylmalate dehydrogenase